MKKEIISTTARGRILGLTKPMYILLFVFAGLVFAVGAQVGPTTFLKLKYEIGHPNIVDQASFAAARSIQDQVITTVGGNPALNIKHPVAGTRCHDCHADHPEGAQHANVALNEADPVASCGTCHVIDLYDRLASLPYFTELQFALADAVSVADAEARVDNAVGMDRGLDLTGVVTPLSEAKWEFEVQRLPTQPGTFPEFYNGLLDKTADALQSVKANHIIMPAVSPGLEVKVEAKAFTLDRAGAYVREFEVLDSFILRMVPAAVPERNVEAKWKDPALPYETAYTFIRDTISAQFGPAEDQEPDMIEWNLGGGAMIKAEFKLLEDNFTSETKVRFEKITSDVEVEAFSVLGAIAARYPTFKLDEGKLEHKYRLNNANTAENALLISTLGTYTASTPLPEKEFKYEVKVKMGTDVFTDMLDFFARKRADHAGSLVKTKTELKWHPMDTNNYEYKVEVVAADRQ